MPLNITPQRITCNPVIDVARHGKVTTYFSDPDVIVELTPLGSGEKLTCPRFFERRCDGRHSCIVNEQDQNHRVVERQ